MTQENKDPLDMYAGGEIQEIPDTKIPWYIKLITLVLPLWGILWFFYFANGSFGWVDRGAWNDLQKAAQTKNDQLTVKRIDS